MSSATEIEAANNMHFDHHSLEHGADPVCTYRAIRENAGVVHSDSWGGYWVLSKYADIAAAARDHATFSSDRERGGATIPPNPATRMSLDELDPPEWKRIRSAFNPTLSPAAVERMKPRIQQITAYCIDQFIEAGVGDLVLDLANPVPAIVTLEFLGLPLDQWERYAGPIHKLAYVRRDQPELADVLEDSAWIFEKLKKRIAECRLDPGDDFVSYLINLDAEGSALSDAEIEEMLFISLGGGIDTTTSLMANTFKYLSEHPEELRRLRDDPSLIDSACEEFLRVFTPIQALARTVTTPTLVADVELQVGDRVLLAWASANRDPDQFPDADDIQLDRFPNRHCSFGIGIHRCLGSNLARTQFKIVVNEVIRRMPDFLVTAGARRYERVGLINGWIEMPVTFTRGPQESSLGAL
jgi:cytochrome P450